MCPASRWTSSSNCSAFARYRQRSLDYRHPPGRSQSRRPRADPTARPGAPSSATLKNRRNGALAASTRSSRSSSTAGRLKSPCTCSGAGSSRTASRRSSLVGFSTVPPCGMSCHTATCRSRRPAAFASRCSYKACPNSIQRRYEIHLLARTALELHGHGWTRCSHSYRKVVSTR